LLGLPFHPEPIRKVKFTPASSIKKTRTYSIPGLWKAATLAFRVEKPPVPIVAKVWQIASKEFMPAQRSAANCRRVKAR
jgi:hypothetical protein